MASAAPRLERHSLVRAAPAAWAAMLAGRGDLSGEPLLIGWAQRGWPLIARRPVCDDIPGAVPLGLPLPPASGRRRLQLSLAPEEIIDSRPPPRLAEAMAAAPAAWRSAIALLVALDADVRCFGSLAWQYVTGLAYLTPDSDLDLLWRVACAEMADTLGVRIAEIAESAPMRIDGEFVTPAGVGVQWREWRSSARQLAVKGHEGVRLADRTLLLP
jgi:phosphoribosyl-dephospho-CoA transferase